MTTKDNGGPAFPELLTSWVDPRDGQTRYETMGGVTLRDYIAIHDPIDCGMSMTINTARSLMGSMEPRESTDPLEYAMWLAEAEARFRYMRADMMLKVRKL